MARAAGGVGQSRGRRGVVGDVGRAVTVVRGELAGTHRAREMVALAELAAEVEQALDLARLLDALGDDPQPERLAERDDRMGERPLVGAPVGRHDEVPGDLQDVDREPAQVAERRVAGPEVVDRDPDAAVAERLELGDRRLGVLEHRRSRSARGRAVTAAGRSRSRTPRSRSMNSGRWTWSGDRLTLTKKSGCRSPAASQAATWRVASSRTQRPSARIMPFSSASRDELVGPDQAAGRVAPADERLDAGGSPGRQLDDRLVVDDQLAAADAPGELRRQRVAGDDRGVHRRVEDRDAALAAGLRRVHRDVGVAQQLVGALDRLASDGDADAAADHELLALDRERDLERLDDPVRDGLRPAQVGRRR